MRDGRPQVTLKLAVTADGKAGAAGRRPLDITGAPARERVHLLRAQNDAVMIGIGTALADDPLLTCRLPGMAARSPVRIVLDSTLRLPPGSRLVRGAGEVAVWDVAGPQRSAAAEAALQVAGVVVISAPQDGSACLDLPAVLKLVAERGITRLMLEGGPILAAAFLKANLIDEAVLLQSPKTAGGDAIDALDRLPLAALTQSPELTSVRCEAVGADMYEVFERR